MDLSLRWMRYVRHQAIVCWTEEGESEWGLVEDMTPMSEGNRKEATVKSFIRLGNRLVGSSVIDDRDATG
jgi:hypothetical protein